MRHFPFITLILSIVIIYACDKTTNDLNINVPEGIISKSLELFDGIIIEKESGEEDGNKTWEIRIQNSEGSKVKFYWLIGNEALHRIDGQEGPFDYDLKPGNNLINFSVAKTVAMGSVKIESLVKWQLRKEEKFNDSWVYNFEFDKVKGSTTVYIDAENGNILKID